MTNKTIRITEESYNLLKANKLEGESFSEEIVRITSKETKKSLMDFFGILAKEEGEGMLKELDAIKEINIRLMKEKYKDFL